MTTSDDQEAKRHKLKFVQEALDEWRALDEHVRAPLKAVLDERLNDPHVPGGALAGKLQGCYKIKLRKLGVRLVYKVNDHAVTIIVLCVGRRENSEVYRTAMERFVENKKPPGEATGATPIPVVRPRLRRIK